MTSLATARVVGLELLAFPLVLVYFTAWICMQDTFASATHSAVRPSARDDRVSCIQGMDTLSAQCIIELDVASVTVSSRVIQPSSLRRLSCACLLTVRRPSHGCLLRVLRQAGCHARHLVGCRTTSCILKD